MKKRLLALALAVIMTVSLLSVTAGAKTTSLFSDVKTVDWYYNAVDYVNSNGLMTGTGTGFAPNGATTRAQIWTILARLGGENYDRNTSDWYAGYQTWAIRNSISDGTNPNGQITREQLATMLYRYAIRMGFVSKGSWADLSVYPDAANVSAFALEAMQWAVGCGLIQGMDGKLNPQGTATRAQVATILWRMCETWALLPEKDVTPVLPAINPSYYPSTPSHTHTYSDEWSSDATHHWHAATCAHTSEVSDKAEHSYTTTTEPSCTEAGVKTCVCGKEQTIDPLNHNYEKNDAQSTDAYDYYKCTRCDDYYTVEKGTSVESIVARVGNTGYTSLSVAATAATDGSTIVILKSTSETLPIPAGNNVTYTALDGVELSGGAANGWWKKSVTFDGLTFKNCAGIFLRANESGISYTVKNCTFDNVTATGVKVGVITVDGSPASVTLTGNTIKDVQNYTGANGSNSAGLQSNGIYVGATSAADVTVSNNIIEDMDGTGIYVATTGKITITGNTISEWGTGNITDGVSLNEGRAIRTDSKNSGSQLTITGNKLLDITSNEDYIKSTNIAGDKMDISGNYWGGNDPMTSGVFSADSGVEKMFVLKNYYTDAAMTNLVSYGVALNDDGAYEISNANGLKWMNNYIAKGTVMGSSSDNISGKSFLLTADIDATDTTWNTVALSIASSEAAINGFTLDGQGHKISGLKIHGYGLFAGYANGSASGSVATTIKNITFDSVTVDGNKGADPLSYGYPGYHVGLVWGELAGALVLDGVHVTNSRISGKCNVGGLVGRNSGDVAATLTFNGCSVKNSTIIAECSEGESYDPAGASEFLGCALDNGHAFTLQFTGTNEKSGNTILVITGQAGGGVYATWKVSDNTTSEVHAFTDHTVTAE